MAAESTVPGYDMGPRRAWFAIANAVGLHHGTLTAPGYLPGVAIAAERSADAASIAGAVEDAFLTGVFP